MQLLRIIRPLEESFDVVYVSTNPKCENIVKGSKFYATVDFNRWNFWKSTFAAIQIISVIIKEHPQTVISTGAAPGLLSIAIGKIFLRDTIWIDSVANVEQLSFCGKVAKKIARHTYTQWPNLADGKVKYAGNIFGDGV